MLYRRKQFLKLNGLMIFARKILLIIPWLITNLNKGNRELFIFYVYNYWITNFPSYNVRILYLRHVLGIEIGHETFIHMGCYFLGKKIRIGDNTVIGRNCYLGEEINIGSNVSLTAHTYIFGNTHKKDSPSFEGYSSPVIIDDYVWTGAKSMIFPGVHIGKGAILGAQSTATRSIPPFCVFVGSPAKMVSKRSENLTYKLRYFPNFQ